MLWPMLEPRSPVIVLLLVLTGLYSAGFAVFIGNSAFNLDGLLLANGNPAGGDFINLWSVGQLIYLDRLAEIYDPHALLAFEQELTGGDIGVRLWAYPPHSLYLAAPFGLIPYYAALTLWSVLGLLVLGYGLHRLNFGWPMVVIGVLSPASWQCIYFGQTGNLAAGLLLIALTSRHARDGVSAISGALLTIKPQLGILLPVVWLMRGNWWLIVMTGILTLLIAGISVQTFGLDAWLGYLEETVPYLSTFEANGTGAFMLMIPSVFISLRVLDFDSGLAFQIHAVIAVVILVTTIVLLRQKRHPIGQISLSLIATSVITPYLHTYDMSLILVGALLMIPGATGAVSHRVLHLLTILIWALPHLMFGLNSAGWPVAPLVLLGLFAYAATQQKGRVDPA